MKRALILLSVLVTACVALLLLRPWQGSLAVGARQPSRVQAAEKPSATEVSPLASVRRSPADRMRALLAALRAGHRFGRGRQAALRALLPGLGEEDLLAALDQTFGRGSDNDMTHVLLERLAAVDADRAIAFGREHHFGTNPPWWMSVIGGLAQPQRVLPDVEGLPAGRERTMMVGYAAGRWALSDPDAAIDYAVHRAPGDTQQAALANAVVFTARKDPARAFELAMTFGPAIADPNLVASVATDWAAHDYAQASARIEALPVGDQRDAALAGLVAVSITRDLPSAFALIPEISDSSAREAFYVQAAHQWLLRDPDGARSWMADTKDLSPAEKASLLGQFAGGKG